MILRIVSWQSLNVIIKMIGSLWTIYLTVNFLSPQYYPTIILAAFIMAFYRTPAEALISQPIIHFGGMLKSTAQSRRQLSFVFISQTIISSIAALYLRQYHLDLFSYTVIILGAFIWLCSQKRRSLLRAKMRFKEISVIDSISVFINIMIMTVLFYFTAHPIAIFIGQLSYFSVNLVLFYLITRAEKFELVKRDDQVKIQSQSIKLAIANTLNTLSNYIENFVASLIVPVSILSSVSLSKDIISKLQQAINFIISQSAFPYLKYIRRTDKRLTNWIKLYATINILTFCLIFIIYTMIVFIIDTSIAHDVKAYKQPLRIYSAICFLKVNSNLCASVLKSHNMLTEELHNSVFVLFCIILIGCGSIIYLENITFIIVIPFVLQYFLLLRVIIKNRLEI